MFEDIWIFPFHQLNIIFCEFKWSSLKTHITRTTRNHKRKVNMYHMTFSINQNVIIMPILYLKQILDQRIASQRLNEVCYWLLPVATKYLLIYFTQRSLIWLFFQITNSSRIINKLYQTWITIEWYYIIWSYPNF